ncbi:MAG: LysM peptidoglycan-binding domain-containing protein, partial [Thermodesulfobacteriota bacterium]
SQRTQVASAKRPTKSSRSTRVASSKSSHRQVASKSKGSTKKKPTVIVHRVRKGQTLGAIARRYGTTVEAIRNLNDVSARSLQIGQRLRIPS